MRAARANDVARAKAFAVLSTAESRFTLIGRALLLACSAKAPAVMADFPSIILGEASTAFSHQLSGLSILHASARVHTGEAQGVVTAFLCDRFDEQGADLINDGVFTLDLDPVQLALGCYPVLQITRSSRQYEREASVSPGALHDHQSDNLSVCKVYHPELESIVQI
jgi:hypothetical protein